jgi:hypothetical protein
MKKSLVLLAFMALASVTLLKHSPAVGAAATRTRSASQFQQVPQEGKGCGAPKSWGQLKGVADRSIAFEDATGTIRVLDLGPCMRGQTQLIAVINRP